MSCFFSVFLRQGVMAVQTLARIAPDSEWMIRTVAFSYSRSDLRPFWFSAERYNLLKDDAAGEDEMRVPTARRRSWVLPYAR